MHIKSLIIGIFIGIIVGAGGMYAFGEELLDDVGDATQEVGKSVRDAGKKLEKAGDKIK